MAAIIVTLLELPGSRMERGRWGIDKGAMLGANVDRSQATVSSLRRSLWAPDQVLSDLVATVSQPLPGPCFGSRRPGVRISPSRPEVQVRGMLSIAGMTPKIV